MPTDKSGGNAKHVWVTVVNKQGGTIGRTTAAQLPTCLGVDTLTYPHFLPITFSQLGTEV